MPAPSLRPRLLLVDDDADLREVLRLQLGRAFEVVGEAGTGEEALELVAEDPPDLVLMDINMPGLDGITATEKLVTRFPEVVVVILSSLSRAEDMRQALAAGARDFVTKPCEAAELRRVLSEAAELQQRRRELLAGEGRPPAAGIWAFTRATGGTGQTTLVLAIANELAAAGKRVVVADAHPLFGHAGHLLQLDRRGPDAADLAALRGEATPADLEELLRTHPAGFRVLTCPTSPLRGQELVPADLARALVALEQHFEYVLVDLPAGVPDAYLPVLDAARLIYLVCNGNLGALVSMRDLLELLLVVDYPLQKLRPVLCGARTDGSLRKEFDKVLERLDSRVAQLFPDDAGAAQVAELRGLPVTRVVPESPYSHAVRRHVVEILGLPLPEPVAREEARGSLLGLLGGLLGG